MIRGALHMIKIQCNGYDIPGLIFESATMAAARIEKSELKGLDWVPA
jgi:hypothetical protein